MHKAIKDIDIKEKLPEVFRNDQVEPHKINLSDHCNFWPQSMEFFNGYDINANPGSNSVDLEKNLTLITILKKL